MGKSRRESGLWVSKNVRIILLIKSCSVVNWFCISYLLFIQFLNMFSTKIGVLSSLYNVINMIVTSDNINLILNIMFLRSLKIIVILIYNFYFVLYLLFITNRRIINRNGVTWQRIFGTKFLMLGSARGPSREGSRQYRYVISYLIYFHS